jgi:hypothetical protein
MALEFTGNQTISLMHQDRASALRAIADHIEKHKYTSAQIIELLREVADEAEAQAMVVELRDTINKR